MKITVEVQTAKTDPTEFYDACMAASRKLAALAALSQHDSDAWQFLGTRHVLRVGSVEIGAVVIRGELPYAE